MAEKPLKINQHSSKIELNMNNLISKFVFPFRYWILFICLNSSVYSNGQAFVDIETGAFFTNVNDIRNGNNGTLFSLKNTFQTPVSPFVRLRWLFIRWKKLLFIALRSL
jgi:hypothetical protein